MLHPYLESKPRMHPTNFVAPSADLIGQVSLGQDSSIWYNCTLRGDINSVEVGTSSNIQDNSVVHVADKFPAIIGSFVSIGHNCTIHACTLADNILVGMGSIVMDGVKVSKNSIIGAGSLISKSQTFPEGSLILGTPARVLRKLTTEEIDYIEMLAYKYVQIKNNYLKNAHNENP